MHDDLVLRDFTAARPDQVWLADITEHPTGEGKLYCCAIKDVFSNRIVGYALHERMTAELAVTALRTALARRQPKHVVIVHSDRGSQFRSRAFRAVLKTAGHNGSMGRVASAGDNAAMESFFNRSRPTSSTASAGPAATSSATPPSPGSSAPTTVAAGSADWAA